MSSKFNNILFSNLVKDSEYFSKVFPYLKKEYFEEQSYSTLFDIIDSHVAEYKKAPSFDVIEVALEKSKGLSEDSYSEVQEILKEISTKEYKKDIEWLIKETEGFCKQKALYNAILESVSIIDGSDKKRDTGIIPELVTQALSVSFDNTIGHDYFASLESRWEFYTQKETKYPSLIKILDRVMHDGVADKTLNLIMAVSGGGKSAAMCSLAASYISQGYDVLYITMELAEERVAERIDANLLNIPIYEVKNTPKDLFCKKLNKIREKNYGNLVIKEYPTGTANVNHFRVLLNELRIKKKFKPKVVFIDYLGICASAHFKSGSSANSYTIQKSIAEEMRGLAVEQGFAVWSAVQANRSGYNNSDMSETSIAESLGILMTADFVLGLIRTPELDENGHVLGKQIKSRYGDISMMNRFIIGFDRARMKLYDVDDQSGIQKSAEIPEEKDMDELSKHPEVVKSNKKPAIKAQDWNYD